jgi:GNAT superfamily N-acetyltransferase
VYVGLNTEVAIRKVNPADISEIIQQRQRMYQDMDCKDTEALRAMASVSESYLRNALDDHSFHGWLAVLGERVTGGGGIIVSPWLSHPYDLECRRATILNVYVYPEFRRIGIAGELMKTMIQWCREDGLAAVYLHASKSGKPLYERLGFESSNEMRLMLR